MPDLIAPGNPEPIPYTVQVRSYVQDPELRVADQVRVILQYLDTETQLRVLRYLVERYDA